MPPKTKASKTLNNSKSASKLKNDPVKISETDKNAISNMFKKIESKDSYMIECKLCSQTIKSCLFTDHMNTKCPNRKIDTSPQKLTKVIPQNDDIIVLSDDEAKEIVNTKIEVQNGIKEEIKETKYETVKNEIHQIEEKIEPDCKRIKMSPKLEDYDKVEFDDDKDDQLLLSSIDQIEKNIKESSFNRENDSIKSEPTFDYYLNNFENALQTVINQDTFSHLLNDFDRETIKKFSNLTSI